MNAILDGGGHVSFATSPTPRRPTARKRARSSCRESIATSSRKSTGDDSLKLKAIAAAPKDVVAIKKARVGLYRSWVANIDEGWTRWILENYGFAPITLRNGDIQAGNLRDHFDAIILPDAIARHDSQRLWSRQSFPGCTRAASAKPGTIALREFVRAGGSLITFNNASLFAIDDLGLPVKNILAGVKDEDFFCSGCLLRVEIQDIGAFGGVGIAARSRS